MKKKVRKRLRELVKTIKKGKAKAPLTRQLQNAGYFDTILANIAAAVTVRNARGQLIYMNDAASKLLGYTSDDILKQQANNTQKFEYIDKDGNVVPASRLPSQRVLKGETHAEDILGLRYKKTGAVRWLMAKARAVHDEKRRVLFAVNIIEDITDLKNEELQREHFLGIASHELKTPLTSIKMFADLMKRQLKKNGDATSFEYVAKIDSKVDRLTKIINDILDMTKIRSRQLDFFNKTVDFDRLIGEAIEDMDELAKDHKIIKKGRAKKTIVVDKDRIYQVLVNLMSNAIKYSPGKNTIIVRVSSTQEFIKVAVEDFGVGIKKDRQARIFDLFYQDTDAQKKGFFGLGIGLYISSEIVKHYGGRLWVNSQLGKGSIFYFTLPLKKQAQKTRHLTT